MSATEKHNSIRTIKYKNPSIEEMQEIIAEWNNNLKDPKQHYLINIGPNTEDNADFDKFSFLKNNMPPSLLDYIARNAEGYDRDKALENLPLSAQVYRDGQGGYEGGKSRRRRRKTKKKKTRKVKRKAKKTKNRRRKGKRKSKTRKH
jgi:hypothetical protein|uniref:Uncharacterized protein n=1 Tax=viral metagenome TaxID=1070528 RepID=A0A6C0IMR5_9ZZZZ